MNCKFDVQNSWAQESFLIKIYQVTALTINNKNYENGLSLGVQTSFIIP